MSTDLSMRSAPSADASADSATDAAPQSIDQMIVDAEFADLNDPEYQQYTVTDASDIHAVMIALMTGRGRANAYFSAPPGSMLTTIVTVDNARNVFMFEMDGEAVRNDALLSAQTIAWRSHVDGVRVEFTTGPATKIMHDRRYVFAATIPDIVLRLQRRNAFRAAPPIAQPMFVMLDPGGKGAREARVRVVDVSALGMCLLVDSLALNLVAGMRIAKARFDLPGFGEIRCSLEVRYILSAGSKHPPNFRRCGVQFAGLAAADAVLVSRYIDNLQRQRAKARFG